MRFGKYTVLTVSIHTQRHIWQCTNITCKSKVEKDNNKYKQYFNNTRTMFMVLTLTQESLREFTWFTR